jgi:alkylated DNA repair dioxygenase AlkB
VTVRAPYQASLFGGSEVGFDATFASSRRIALDASAWIDLVPAWVSGEGRLFEQIRASQDWAQRDRWMYDRRVPEPRLTARWALSDGTALEPPVLEAMRLALSARYGVLFDSAGFNLYRDGRDSVAWHRDRIRREIALPIVALVSLGEPRSLLFRPRVAQEAQEARKPRERRSLAFPIGHGDLLVTGGTAQRTWEHAVLKTARAGSRISIAFRYGMHPRAYGVTA